MVDSVFSFFFLAGMLIFSTCVRALFWFPSCTTGCKNCANVVPDVFRIEENFGRARVCSQSGNPALVQEAIDTW